MGQDNQSQDVKFEEEQLPQTARFSQEQAPKVTQWIMKSSGGYASGESRANYVLLGLVLIAIIASLLIIFNSSRPKNTGRNIDPVTGREIIPGQISGGI